MDNFSLIFFINLVFFSSLLLFRNVFIPLIITVGFLAAIFWLIKNNKLRPEQLQVPFPKINLNSINYISGVACLVLFLILEKYIGFNSALLSAFFLFSHLNKLDSRAGFSMALIILIITAVLSISKNLKAGQEMAILAYYFLIVGAVWATMELRHEEAEEGKIIYRI